MYEFKTKLVPFARGFLNCESEDKLEKTVAGILMSAREMPVSINKKTGICDGRVEAPTGYFYGTAVCCFSDWIMDLAKDYPEDREDLIVRVGGYCDYFVNIGKSLQDNVIARTSIKI